MAESDGPKVATVPGATRLQSHPMLPYGESPLEVEVNGRKFLVKESDLDLIDLTPHPKRPWRSQCMCDYHVVAHRGWMKPMANNKVAYRPLNPANLGFFDCSRNKQIAATYKLDTHKVDVIHKLWRNHLALAKQWAKVDAMSGEQYDLDKWAKANQKRMHPLIRTWYRLKEATDALAEFRAETGAAARAYMDAVKRQCDIAIKIEQLINTTGRYLDSLLERRISEKRKRNKSPANGEIVDADAEVLDNMADIRLKDVDQEIASIKAELLDDDALEDVDGAETVPSEED